MMTPPPATGPWCSDHQMSAGRYSSSCRRIAARCSGVQDNLTQRPFFHRARHARCSARETNGSFERDVRGSALSEACFLLFPPLARLLSVSRRQSGSPWVVRSLYVSWALAGNVSFFAAMQTRQHREHQELLRTMELRREREATILRQKSEFLARQRLEPKLHTGEQRTKTKQRAAQKLTASALVGRLRQVNAFGVVANPECGLHCIENRGDWDDTCLFIPSRPRRQRGFSLVSSLMTHT